MALTIISKPFQLYLWRSRASLELALWLSLSTSLVGQPFEIDTVQWTGDADQRINLVFFGDGYQIDELVKYNDDVALVVEHFFSQTPFKEYQSYFNIISFQVPSNTSGASRDPETPLDTYFGSSYNSFEIERLLVATQQSRAQQILFDQFPLYDQAVLVVNDDKYGGSGGWLATTSTHRDAPEIALHEIGHSFAGLSDEYWAGSQFARESPNMTQESDPQKVKWNNWIGYKEVEVFPYGVDPQWYRPHENCKMRILNPAFCPVCTETITKRIQSLINPTLGFSPMDLNVTLQDDTITFALQLLTPNPNTFHFDWRLDQDPFAGPNSETQKLHASMLDPGTYQWQVTYFDSTTLVRDAEHVQSITYAIDWVVQNDIVSPSLEVSKADFSIYPNPTHGQIRVNLNQGISRRWFEIRDLLGRILQSGSLNQDAVIDLRTFRAGIYHLTVFGGHKGYSRAIIKH